MTAEMARLPLPEPDDAHPMDWYPEPNDDPKGVPVEIVNQWVEETLTRREDGKIETGADDVCTAPAPYTARLFGSPAMPFQRTMRRRPVGEPRVYFFRCSNCCNLVKIGYSRDYLRRRVQLEQLPVGHVLEILGTHIGDRAEEARVHALFAADRVEGEWFRYSDAIREYIRDHTDRPRTEWPPFNREGRYGAYKQVRP